MKILGVAAAVLFLGLAGVEAGDVSAFPYRVEVSFTYQRQAGPGSNQIALWVEDAGGRVVRTVYVANFTAARGGWKYRENSVPRWVRQANIAGMTDKQVDAFTGATPTPGSVTLVWDGLDNAGISVPAGEYRILLEATLRNENQALYQAVVKVGGPAGEVRPRPEYLGVDVPEREMLGNVVIRHGK